MWKRRKYAAEDYLIAYIDAQVSCALMLPDDVAKEKLKNLAAEIERIKSESKAQNIYP